jgi:hypothetical protein
MSIGDRRRSLTPSETAVIAAIVSASAIPDAGRLLDLDGAYTSDESSAKWILDIETTNPVPRVHVPNGPLSVRAFVPDSERYQGEVIVWITGDYLSGLEYSWITDEAPARWPRPDEMQLMVESVRKNDELTSLRADLAAKTR